MKIMISYLVDTIVVFVVLNLIDPILIPIKIFFCHITVIRIIYSFILHYAVNSILITIIQ